MTCGWYPVKNKLPGNLFPAWSARCFTGRLFLLWAIGLGVIFPLQAQTTFLDSVGQEPLSTLFSKPLLNYTFNKDPEKQRSDTTHFDTYNLLEYHYRMGKSKMAASETKEAVIHLKQVWNIAKQKKPGYMTTYAVLELASHYKQTGDLPNARLWAKRCLSTNTGPYSHHVKQQISWLEL